MSSIRQANNAYHNQPMEDSMDQTNFSRASGPAPSNFVSAAAPAGVQRDERSGDAAAEKKAERLVKGVGALRIVLPVVVITAILASATWKPTISVETAVNALADTQAVRIAAAHNYFPGQDVGHAAPDVHAQGF
jgi:hypothetical protein